MMHTKAAVIYELGKDRPYASSKPFVIEEVTLENPGPGEVLVELVSAGLCHSDLSVIDGSRPRPMPMVLGHEAAGIVREIGSGVTRFQPDDHVIFSFVPICGHCLPCATGRPALCEPGARANLSGLLLSGAQRIRSARGQPVYHHLGVSAFAQHTIAAQESLIKIDSAYPLERAALFGCAAITGVGAVLNTAQLAAGTSVAVWGMGGVGLSIIMGAKLAGAAPIIAVDVLASKLELAHELGASHTIDASKNDVLEAIRDLTGGGAEYTFEAVGNEQALEQAFRATQRGGTTITVGLPGPNRMLNVPAVMITAEERTIKGSFMGSAVPQRDIPRLLELHAAGLLPIEKLHTHTIALEQINAGFDDLASGSTVRTIIDFSRDAISCVCTDGQTDRPSDHRTGRPADSQTIRRADA